MHAGIDFISFVIVSLTTDNSKIVIGLALVLTREEKNN